MLHIPLVLVGTRTALQFLILDSQYSSRFEVVFLPNRSVNADFQRFLKNFESALPLTRASKLYSPELTTLIHAISIGSTSNIKYLLRECARESIQTGAEVIDRQLLVKNRSLVADRADASEAGDRMS